MDLISLIVSVTTFIIIIILTFTLKDGGFTPFISVCCLSSLLFHCHEFVESLIFSPVIDVVPRHVKQFLHTAQHLIVLCLKISDDCLLMVQVTIQLFLLAIEIFRLSFEA